MKKNPTNLDVIKRLHISKHLLPSYSDEGKPITVVRFVATDIKSNKKVGYTDINPKTRKVIDVSIDRVYRRQGVATYLYDYVERDMNISIHPSEDLPEVAEKFWKHRARTKLVRHLGTRKNPSNLVTSSPSFKDFLKLLAQNEIDYENVVRFGLNFSNEQLAHVQYLIDFATIIYFKGMLKGFSRTFSPSRYHARTYFLDDLQNIEGMIKKLFKDNNLPPYRKVK